jgi:small subunit ribosomal protein S9
MAKNTFDYGTGRRKSSIARAFLKDGKGLISVNGKKIGDYFPANTDWWYNAVAPLVAIQVANKFDLKITVKGGGITGQSGAVCLAIARALVNYELRLLNMTAAVAREKNAELKKESQENESEYKSLTPWHDALRAAGLLTRDSRAVERKVFGLRKARKRRQFSKR